MNTASPKADGRRAIRARSSNLPRGRRQLAAESGVGGIVGHDQRVSTLGVPLENPHARVDRRHIHSDLDGLVLPILSQLHEDHWLAHHTRVSEMW